MTLVQTSEQFYEVEEPVKNLTAPLAQESEVLGCSSLSGERQLVGFVAEDA